MDAEQVNQAGAQDALDAGQQNTSDDARRDLPVAEGTVQDTAPETPAEAPGEVHDESSVPGRPAPGTAPEASAEASGEVLDVAPAPAPDGAPPA
ncbi:hypothetical protein ACFU0Y_18165, partial [Kocuria sp. NPDC057446]